MEDGDGEEPVPRSQFFFLFLGGSAARAPLRIQESISHELNILTASNDLIKAMNV